MTEQQGRPGDPTGQPVGQQVGQPAEPVAPPVKELSGAAPVPLWQVLGGVTGVVALLGAVFKMLRRRRRPATPSERLLETGREVSQNLGRHAGRFASEATEVAGKVAATAAPVVLAGAGAVAKEGPKLATKVGTQATQVGTRAAHVGARATKAGSRAGEEVVEHLEGVQKGWRKLLNRVTAALALGGGYVLGARAGRERYDQIVRAADRARSNLNG